QIRIDRRRRMKALGERFARHSVLAVAACGQIREQSRGANMSASILPKLKTVSERGAGRVGTALGGPTLWVTGLVVGACLLLVPAPASAQGTSGIAGVVRDT